MITVAAVLYYAICITYGILILKKQFISLPLIFIVSQFIMFSGILILVDESEKSDVYLVWIYLIALVSFICGVQLSRKMHPVKMSDIKYINDSSNTKKQQLYIGIIIIISILACIYLFVSAGNNIFVNIMQAFLSSETNINVTENRLSMYSVAGVGYIYQFRVILLPVLTAYLISFSKNKKLGFILFPFMIIFLLGTGQRGGFVTFGLMWMLTLVLCNKYGSQFSIKKIICVCAIIFALFAIMTIANGRVTTDNQNVLNAMLERFTNDNQLTAVQAFKYIYKQPTQYGNDWFMMIKDLLPGKNSYLPVSNRVFDMMYGSTRGTAPPCIWGSTYYNWGIIGIMIFPFILGFSYQTLFKRFVNYPITPLRLLIYSSMFIVLGTWIADAPVVLFNQGFVTLCILAAILHIDKNAIIKGEKNNDINHYSSL